MSCKKLRTVITALTIGLIYFINQSIASPNYVIGKDYSVTPSIGLEAFLNFPVPITIPDQPIPLKPGNGSSNIDTRPTLTWNFDADVSVWHLQAALNESFSSTIYDDTTIIKNSRQIGALPCNSTIYWRVRAKDADGWSTFSDVFSFQTMGAPQNTSISIRSSFLSPGSRPTGLAWDGRNLWMVDNLRNLYKMDTVGNVIASYPVSGFSDDRGLMWDGTGLWIVVGIHNYKLDTLGNRIDTLDVQHWWHSGLDWDGKYFWFGNYNFSSLHKHTKDGSEILNFDLNEIFGHPTGLAYDGKNIWVGTSSEGFTDDIFKYSTMGAYVYEFDLGTIGLSPPSGSYASLAWDGRSLWYASDDQFTIYRLNVPYYHQEPAIPSLISPPDGDSGVELTPTLSWNESVNAEKYDLQVATDIAFNDLVFDISDISSTSLHLGALEVMTNYYWHVRATNPLGSSLYSPSRSFTTQGLDLHSDSLALVALYNSTNGANWTNNTNWLTGNVSTWYGVTVSGDRVTEIDLRTNNLVGTIPPEIGLITDLTALTFELNQLSGLIPWEIGNLSKLNALSLPGNQLSGAIPSEIGNLTSLQTLTLYGNQLTIIPAEIGYLTNLMHLSLYSNLISGSIPAEIGNLTNLTTLTLYSNQLLGSIPPEIGNLTGLTVLNLNNNQFTGNIPSEIGNLTNLEYLNLYSNQLSGSVPSEIGNLTNLALLYLNDNQLIDLPGLSALSSLNDLQIQNNIFTFRDIEPNVGVANTTFIYSPQDSVGEIINATVYKGMDYILAVSTGGANSQYQWKKNGVDIGGISSDSTYTLDNITLSDSGTYTCTITNTVASDLTLYSRTIHLNPMEINVIVDFPYFEDFENNDSDWIAGGTYSSWQWGTPAGSIINLAASDTTSWVTNLTGNYNSDEVSYVVSPIFNFSSLNDPAVEMKVWWDIEGTYDGACFQYSTDTGKNWATVTKETDYLWYNRSDLITLHNAVGFIKGWSGDGTFGQGSNGWVTAIAPLTGLDGEPHIQFRFAFASNGSYEKNGFAFDDVRIFSDPSAGIQSINDINNLKILPNPFTDKTVIEFNNPSKESYQLTISNLTGTVLKTINNITDSTIEINRTGLLNGFYVVKLSGLKTYLGKIVIN